MIYLSLQNRDITIQKPGKINMQKTVCSNQKERGQFAPQKWGHFGPQKGGQFQTFRWGLFGRNFQISPGTKYIGINLIIH